MSYYRYRPSGIPIPSDTPGTNFIIAANVTCFVLLFLRLFPPVLLQLLVSTTLDAWHSPWTFFTYPLVSIPDGLYSLISFIFAIIWLYFVGGMLERAWGTRRFLVVFFVFSAISALSLAVGGVLLGINVDFGQLYTPLVALTVIWALLDPTAQVLFFFFPMQLRWLAVLVCVMFFFEYGQTSPILGLFSLGGSGVAFLYMGGRRFLSGNPYRGAPSIPKPGKLLSHLNPFEWYRRWKFKRRFKRLWGD